MKYPISLFICSLLLSCESENVEVIPQWDVYEIVLKDDQEVANAYTDIDLFLTFLSSAGDTLLRPAFYDGGHVWKVRFTPPKPNLHWSWTSYCSNTASRLHKQSGSLRSIDATKADRFSAHGLLRMSDGYRSVVHADGGSFFVVGDTPWALPFRATTDQVREYASDRQKKGFNAALLMTIQPDMDAEGPVTRNTELGFARGFKDLHMGHINLLNPTYFQYLDTLVDILRTHEIVPVFQPVFHGYGWKGKRVLGNHIIPAEYVRYTKYLLARYGAGPAMWLIAGDNGGDDPGVHQAGEMLEQWDCYQQPTGLHYNPCDDYVATWAIDNPIKHCEHYNRTHQAATWLDFQWAQTGHSNEHLYHKVERMYANLPIKAAANGEPTYEGMNNGKNGLGWWQGEDAWMQLMSGGTMGVFYGAACLWQWKVTPDEEGWPAWTDNAISWRGALDLSGSTYVGLVGQILGDYDLTDIEKQWHVAGGIPTLVQGDELYISYVANGRDVEYQLDLTDVTFEWIDPKTGLRTDAQMTPNGQFSPPNLDDWVLVGEH